jgi:drug/metabolite transporter (DMT)-like permease
MYFFLLHHLTASRMSLITLLTPVLALWLGQWVNGEVITLSIYLGTTVILCGLACYEWGDTLLKNG